MGEWEVHARDISDPYCWKFTSFINWLDNLFFLLTKEVTLVLLLYLNSCPLFFIVMTKCKFIFLSVQPALLHWPSKELVCEYFFLNMLQCIEGPEVPPNTA